MLPSTKQHDIPKNHRLAIEARLVYLNTADWFYHFLFFPIVFLFARSCCRAQAYEQTGAFYSSVRGFYPRLLAL